MKHKITENDENLTKKKQKIDFEVFQNGEKQLEVFTSLEFKNLLKEPTTQFQGLQKFWKASEHYDPENKNEIDIVKSYISSSPDCVEIFKCCRAQSSTNELTAIFKCLLHILNRTAGDLKESYEKVGYNICGSLIQSHLQKIYHALELRQSPRIVPLILKMLTMLVMQSKNAAREVANGIDFSLRCFKEILDKRKGKLGHEIKVAYVRFILSFFMADDANVSRKILEVYGFVSTIFKGMINDPASLVQLVITTLKERVVQNPLISKTTKVRFFAEPKVLSNIAVLLEWDGVVDVLVEKGNEQDYIRELVHDFLYHVCCPFKCGINFKDKTLGILEKSKNHVLLDFVVNLLHNSSSLLTQNLIVEIVKACPDLLPKITADFRLSLDPKEVGVWSRNYQLVRLIYEAQPDVAIAVTQTVMLQPGHGFGDENDKVGIDMLVKMTMPGLFALNFTSNPIQKHCLKHKSVEVRTKALQMLLLFLNKAKSTILYASTYQNWERNSYSVEEVELFVDQLKDTLLNSYISVPLIVSTWKECDESRVLVTDTLLKILCVLHEMFPEAVADAKFDFTRLLFGVDLSKSTVEADAAKEQNCSSDVLILRMLAKSSQQYKWFKVIQNGQSAFRRLLQIIYDSQSISNATFKEAVVLIKTILITNNVLDKNEISEADIWIKHLPKGNKTHNDVALLNYLDEICSLVVRRPVQYNNLLTSIRESGEKSNSSDSNLATVDQSFWDTIPDVDIEQGCVNEIKIKSASNFLKVKPEDSERSSRLVSLLTVTAIDNMQYHEKFGSEEKAVLDRYFCSVLTKIFHQLSSAEDAKIFVQIFETLIKNVPKFESSFVCLSKLKVFLSLWTSNSAVVSSDFILSEEDLQCSISNWLWKVCKSKKFHKGLLLKKIIMYCDERKGVNNRENLSDFLSQVLLYFDTLHQFQAQGKLGTSNYSKEFLCVVTYLLQYSQNFTIKDSSEELKVNDDEILYGTNIAEFQSRKRCPYQLILANPSVEDHFFKDPSLSYTEHFDCIAVKPENLLKGSHSPEFLWSYLATDAVVKVQNIPSKEISYSTTLYTTKVTKLFTQLLQELSCSESTTVNTNYYLLNAFTKLCPLMRSSTLQQSFSDLTDLVSNVNSIAVASMLSAGICGCAEALLAQGSMSVDKNSSKNVFLLLESTFLQNKDGMQKLAVQLIEIFPHIATFVPESFIAFCNANPSPLSIALLSRLTQQNAKLLLHWCEMFKFNEADEDKLALLSPVLSQALSMLLHVSHRKDKSSKTLSAKIMKMYKSIIFLPLNDSLKTFSRIMLHSDKFIDRIITLTSKVEQDCLLNFIKSFKEFNCSSTDDLETMMYIAKALMNSNISEDVSTHLKADMVRICANSELLLGGGTEQKDSVIVFSHLNCILEHLKYKEFSLINPKLSEIWNNFLKNTLKNHFCDAVALKCLLQLVPVIFHESEEASTAVNQAHPFNAATFKSMVTSHSKFLTAFLHEKSDLEKDTNEELKAVLTELLLELCIRCDIDALSEKDVAVLLGGYGCTLSRSDQNILKILLVYEQKNIDTSTMRPFLWGNAAVSSFKARKSLGDTLWKKPGSNEMLSCLDSTIMQMTLARFPLRRRMLNLSDDLKMVKYFENDQINTISASENKIVDSSRSTQQVYDPCFILPALLDLLSPENLVDCKAFVRSGAMSFLMCSLASHCSFVRSLAASCLGLYYQHAQTAWFSENNLTMYLIRLVRNGTELKSESDTVPRLSSVVANFLSNVIRLHQSPEDHMFAVLHRFLLVKPQFDLKNVPEFYVLFFSAEMESKLERTWILNLIAEGLRDMGDYHVIKKRNIFQLLLCLHDSPVSDNYVRRQVFQIFEEACSIRSVANDLVKNIGFVTWLSEVVLQQPSKLGASCVYKSLGDPGKRQENTLHIVRVMSTLWKSLNVCDFVAVAEENGYEESVSADAHTENDGHEKRAALAPFRVVKHIIMLSTSLLENLLSISNKKSFAITEILLFIEEALQVLLSCLSNLEERRKQAANKRLQESQLKDFCDLQKNQISVLFGIGDLLTKDNNTSSAVLLLVAVFTFWTKEQSDNEFSRTSSCNLWVKCASWILDHALPICVTNSEWVEKFLNKLFNWIKIWLSSSNQDQYNITDLLLRSYDLLYCIREETRIETIGILNSVLRHRTAIDSESDGDWSGVLYEMQKMRKMYWEENM